jgi:hypothetical protein
VSPSMCNCRYVAAMVSADCHGGRRGVVLGVRCDVMQCMRQECLGHCVSVSLEMEQCAYWTQVHWGEGPCAVRSFVVGSRLLSLRKSGRDKGG